MDPDPYTASWRDWLTDLIDNGEAARNLTPAQLHRAQTLLAGEPLDCDAMRSVVLEVRGRVCADRYRSLGIPHPAEVESRWRCLNPFCLHKGRWWMSACGVINCWNCRQPAFPSLVVAAGEAEDAPFVKPDRSNQAVAPNRSTRAFPINPFPETESAAIV